MTDHEVIYEQAGDGSWSAHIADLPVYTVGDTKEEAARDIQEALALYQEYNEELARAGRKTAPANK